MHEDNDYISMLSAMAAENDEIPELNGSDYVDVTQFGPNADLRRWMTAAKVMMPIMQVALMTPSRSGQSLAAEDIQLRLKDLSKATAEITVTLKSDLEAVGVSINEAENRWGVRKLFSFASTLVAEQYKAYGSTDINELKRLSCAFFSMLNGSPSNFELTTNPLNVSLANHLADAAKDFQHLLFSVSESDEYPELPAGLGAQNSMESAIADILFKSYQFSLGVSIDESMDFAVSRIHTGAKTLFIDATKNLNRGEISIQTKEMMMQSCIDKSKKLLSMAWELEQRSFYEKIGTPQSQNVAFYVDYKRNNSGISHVETQHNSMLGRYSSFCKKGKEFVEALLSDNVFDSVKPKPSL